MRSLNQNGWAYRENWNENWRFAHNPPQADALLCSQDFDDGSWRMLNLPHDYSIEQDFTLEVSSEVGHLSGGVGWYRKAFVLPQTLQGKLVRVCFEGVYMDSHIWVNGKKVGNYPNGYLPFSFDITDNIVCDGKTENIIAVKTTNQTKDGFQSSRWYSGSGIYRNVFLAVFEKIHVVPYGVAVCTPNIAQELPTGAVTVQLETVVQNETDQGAEIQLKQTLLSYEDTQEVQQPMLSQTHRVEAKGAATIQESMTVQCPKLWSVDAPNLYLMKTEVVFAGKVQDTYFTRFGFTWSEFLPIAQAQAIGSAFLLNGSPLKLHGVCLHHDQGALGAVANTTAMMRQLTIMKEMGVNAIRVTHNPAAPAFLQLCDEMGLLVIEEAFDTWYGTKKANDYGRFFEQPCSYPHVKAGTTWAKFDLQQMVRSDRSCPCIIAWSIGNEILQTNEPKGIETAKQLKGWVKEIDTIHPVTMGEDKLRDSEEPQPNVQAVADIMDIVGLNYSEKRYTKYAKERPNWRLYGSETSSAIKSRGYYADPQKTGTTQTDQAPKEDDQAQDAALYQLSSYDNRAVPWGKTASSSLIADRDSSWTAGQFVWTGFDYLGEPTPWNISVIHKPKSSYFGIVDTAGFPKDDYYLYQSQWQDKCRHPMVHIFPHWNWEQESLRSKVMLQGGRIPLRVYSNAPVVELFLNGESCGEQRFYPLATGGQQQSQHSDRLYLEWLLEWKYQPGTRLTAVAKELDGTILATDTVVTAGKEARLSACLESKTILADGNSLCYIPVEVQDADGNPVPTAANEIVFQIEGEGEIVGVDNGDASSWERYKDTEGIWKRKAFNGKALVIVQSTKRQGSFRVTAYSAGLKACSVVGYTVKERRSDRIAGYEMAPILDRGNPYDASLPKEVCAVFEDGHMQPMEAVWKKSAENPCDEWGVSRFEGTVQSTNDPIQTQLILPKMIGVKPVSMVVQPNQPISLPDMAEVLWSDGVWEKKAVVWKPSDNHQALHNKREFFGLVEGTVLSAVGMVHFTQTQGSSTAKLADLQVNGVTIPDFSEDREDYLYSLDFACSNPVVAASPQNEGTAVVCQRVDRQGATVLVVSKDGHSTKQYTIQFIRQKPMIERVSLAFAAPIQEDDILPLCPQIVLQNQQLLPMEAAIATYSVENLGGEAAVKNHKLLAYTAGEISVAVQVHYKGKTICSQPVTVTIEKGTHTKRIESFEPIVIHTLIGTKPQLPNTALARFDCGLPRSVKTHWKLPPQEVWNQMGTVEVEGVADALQWNSNGKIFPKAQVLVVCPIAAQNHAMAAAKGFPVELPTETAVYFSDGSVQQLPVRWKTEEYNTLNDVRSYCGEVVCGNRTLPLTAAVRIEEGRPSVNYVAQRNGYEIPAGLASYSNERTPADNLNDNHITFGETDKIWSNQATVHRKEDWISAVIADEGVPTQKIVNQIRVGFVGTAPAEYHVEYYTGELDCPLPLSQKGTIEELGREYPLNNPTHWTEVAYTAGKPLPKEGEMTKILFQPVKTHLIRVLMRAKDTDSLAVNQLQVYGETVEMKDSFEVTDLLVDGISHKEWLFSPAETICLRQGEPFPQIEVRAANNGAITIVPATKQCPVAKILLVPENGGQAQTRKIEIPFEWIE